LDNFTTYSIPYISCDSADYPGNLGVSDVVDRATAANVSAILFYSRTENYCNMTGTVGQYTTFYSMTSAASSNRIYYYLNSLTRAQSGGTQARIITQQSYENLLNVTPYGLPHGKTTAIAMIALYAVTGLITILFLIIIVTGAVRAHRHPERYGPRNIIGRPRQSRAKGLARAMLDTLPIVKFGDPLPSKQHGDVELADSASVEQREAASGSEHILPAPVVPVAAGHEAKNNIMTERNNSVADSADTDADSKHDAAVPIAAEADSGDQMCSICTDEFELGEDIRLLPCNHMFHPACVDPWLLDISGTCPLCRIDLNPTTTNTEATEATDSATTAALAPPLDPSSGRRARVYRALFGERTAAATPRASPQETVEALRRYREANRRRSVDDPAREQADQQRTRRFFTRRNRAARS